ncbi:hypothetical protein [Clostridium sp.]|uniref:hypothetical protein n=1 Tax=Clostridium sp. TaxID=1506 RepID=UPI0032164A18
MLDYKQIDLDRNMENLKEVLKNHDLLRFRYLIRIIDRFGRYDECYEIEDKEVKERYKESTEDMSRYLQKAEIDIRDNKVELHFEYEGATTYKADLRKTRQECNNFYEWLEAAIITVIDERECRRLG